MSLPPPYSVHALASAIDELDGGRLGADATSTLVTSSAACGGMLMCGVLAAPVRVLNIECCTCGKGHQPTTT
jgi:hypothetical protein